MGMLLLYTQAVPQDVLWRYSTIWGMHSPALIGDNILIRVGSSRLQIISPNGKRIWDFTWRDSLADILPVPEDHSKHFKMPVVAEDGCIYMPVSLNSNDFTHFHGYLLAFDSNYRLRWKLPLMPLNQVVGWY